jgi:hypothetical protein
MRAMNRRLLRILTIVALVLATAQTTRGFSTLGSTWPDGVITMEMQLAGGSNLADGSANFNAAATSALTIWNENLTRVRFAPVNSTAGRGDGDQFNQVFFDSNYYGISFDRDLLAITTRWTLGTERVEADVVFNNAYHWDSYRGSVRANGVWDLRRIALHEFGHVLGLDHPDEHGQHVDALMNSIRGNLDTLTADDIAGIKALYGAPTGAPGNVTFPPPDDATDFYNQLIAVHGRALRAAPPATYVDSENAVIWVREYLRYRLNNCNHTDATDKVLQQIRGLGIQPVCTQ